MSEIRVDQSRSRQSLIQIKNEIRKINSDTSVDFDFDLENARLKTRQAPAKPPRKPSTKSKVPETLPEAVKKSATAQRKAPLTLNYTNSHLSQQVDSISTESDSGSLLH